MSADASPRALPIAPEDVARELRSSDDRVVTAAASALGALSVRTRLPSAFAVLVDDLVDVLTREERASSAASALAALSGLCATVDGARDRALRSGVCARVGARVSGSSAEATDEASGATRVNALDFFRFLQADGDPRGFEQVRGDPTCFAFVMQCSRGRGTRELDVMQRVGGVDLLVNFAQQCADDADAFDALMREGGFDAFVDALQSDDDDVSLRGLIGLACALPRRRALRARLAEDGAAVRRLATFMGSAQDHEVKGFASGLFRALAIDPETKSLVEKALREGASAGVTLAAV